MPEVQTALRDQRTDDLQALLENFARRGDFDAALVTDAGGADVHGVTARRAGRRYTRLTTRAAASSQVIFSAVPVGAGGQPVGDTLRRYVALSRWMDAVRGSAAAEVALYQSGRLMTTSFATPGVLPAAPPGEYLGGTAATSSASRSKR